MALCMNWFPNSAISLKKIFLNNLHVLFLIFHFVFIKNITMENIKNNNVWLDYSLFLLLIKIQFIFSILESLLRNLSLQNLMSYSNIFREVLYLQFPSMLQILNPFKISINLWKNSNPTADIDECVESDSPPCLANEHCRNHLGSFSCHPKLNCGRGYTMNEEGTACDGEVPPKAPCRRRGWCPRPHESEGPL